MPALPDKPFDDVRVCGLWQENGTCIDCLARKHGECLFRDVDLIEEWEQLEERLEAGAL